MSQTSEEATTESGFDSIINCVWHALDVARRELALQRDEDNMLGVTRNTFRRRRRAGRLTVSSTEIQAPATTAVWRVQLFLLPNCDQVVLPPNNECNKLTRIGLGIPSHDLPEAATPARFVQLSWTLPEFNNYICQSFPKVALNVIGFYIARADKSRVLTKIQANTVKELKAVFGRSRVYIIPRTNIALPLEISEPERTHALPETSPPAEPETDSRSLPACDEDESSSSTPPMPTPTASPTANRPAASPTVPPAVYVGPSRSPAPSAVRSLTSAPVPEVTPSALTEHGTAVNLSLEANLDPAQWLNAGTPEVFYRRSRVEPLNRNPVSDFVTDDAEDGEDDDITVVTLESDSPPSEEVALAILLRTFQEDHLSNDVVSTICIRRKKLLESAIKAISRVTFCWTHTPHIEFVGEDADDMGGPQREFFRLLMIELQTSLGIFEGKGGQVLFSYDQAALDQRKYFKGGNLIAWSIAHGGPGIKALDPSLFQLMCGQEPPLEQFDWHVLPDPDVQGKVEKILQCKTAGDLTALRQDLGDWIAECGVPGIFSATPEDIPRIYAYVVKHHIFLRTARMSHQFTDGMNAFGKLWDLVKKNWIAFLPLFINIQEPLSKAAFKAIFSYNYSPRGTNHREAEEDTIYSLEMVFNMIEDKVTELRFEDLLIFITGADEVPALGFPRKPCIDFYDQETGERRLPYASTCMMCLYLPRGVPQENELEQMLFQATRDCLGFGEV